MELSQRFAERKGVDLASPLSLPFAVLAPIARQEVLRATTVVMRPSDDRAIATSAPAATVRGTNHALTPIYLGAQTQKARVHNACYNNIYVYI